MKPTANFRMTATTKYLLSTITDDAARNAFKANMIQAQLQSEVKPPAKDKK
jgi:hypothetical protein